MGPQVAQVVQVEAQVEREESSPPSCGSVDWQRRVAAAAAASVLPAAAAAWEWEQWVAAAAVAVWELLLLLQHPEHKREEQEEQQVLVAMLVHCWRSSEAGGRDGQEWRLRVAARAPTSPPTRLLR